eukprot:TRINITY_DN83666_c0_g1_i1.p1 TRINITY_DN83666_c0_g1~~TRINITY_DN83666_c0_g1_i1.p1  ORF type:complete len:239 (+),score=52.65 TRINITY_DN83666_c0_g1_i1:68-784(+)
MFSCCCSAEKEEDALVVPLDVKINHLSAEYEPVTEKESKEAPEELPPWHPEVSPQVPERLKPVVLDIVVLRKPAQPFGMDLSASGSVCVVNTIPRDGVVGEHNASASPDLQVRQYDRLLSVNGDAPSKGKEILELLKVATGDIALRFQRPVMTKAILKKDARGSLGVMLKEGPNFLLVTRVVEGPVEEYNATVSADQALVVSSRIFRVNGASGGGEALMKLVLDPKLTEVPVEFMTWT